MNNTTQNTNIALDHNGLCEICYEPNHFATHTTIAYGAVHLCCEGCNDTHGSTKDVLVFLRNARMHVSHEATADGVSYTEYESRLDAGSILTQCVLSVEASHNTTQTTCPKPKQICQSADLLNAGKSSRRRKPVGYRQILRWESDAKTVKGKKKGYLTGIMYLAPADTSGVINVCVNASKGCKKSCLFKSGHALVWKSVNVARIAKTRFMVENPEAFKASLVYDIESLRIEALSRGLTPCVRINGTSDLPKLAHDMALRFRDVQFYDYTKLGKAWQRTMANYHLTFSHSEDNHGECMEALRHGINVAVVFGIKKGVAFPATWHGHRVINGDESDLRFLDPVGVVVGLYAKGKAKLDDTGFVVRDLITIQSAA